MITHITDRERELQAANAALLAEVARLKFAFMDGFEGGKQEARDVAHAEIDGLRTELEKIKPQESVGHLAMDGCFIQNQRYVMENGKVPRAMPLYLAPGAQPRYEEQPDGSVIPVDPSEMDAQPVPEGMVLVPCDPTDVMIRSYLVAQSTAAMQTDRAFGMSDPMENFKAGYKSMLEAAKETK